MPGPRIVSNTGYKVFWCQKLDRQLIDKLCYWKYFSKHSKACRKCLGLAKGQRLPDPWGSLGKEEGVNTLEIDCRHAIEERLVINSKIDAMGKVLR